MELIVNLPSAAHQNVMYALFSFSILQYWSGMDLNYYYNDLAK